MKKKLTERIVTNIPNRKEGRGLSFDFGNIYYPFQFTHSLPRPHNYSQPDQFMYYMENTTYFHLL